MTKKIIDFSKNIIYKLVCKDLDIKDTYVGSTTDFTRRKAKHKHCCTNSSAKGYEMKVYQIIRENGGWENYDMVEIEKWPCKDSNEARSRERYWYEQLNANLNMNRPIFTKEDKKQLNKDYRETHQEEINNYRDENKEKTKAYNKDYYSKNKEKHFIEDYCDICQLKYYKFNSKRHMETKGHLKKTIQLLEAKTNVLQQLQA